MIKLLRYARYLHRVLVLLITALTLFMAGTGIILRYTVFSAKHFSFLDLGQVRYLHNRLSVVFTVLLLVMALTGWLMYLIPAILRRRQPVAPKPLPPIQ
jgi:Trk-type K+ transport system membrane component